MKQRIQTPLDMHAPTQTLDAEVGPSDSSDFGLDLRRTTRSDGPGGDSIRDMDLRVRVFE